MKIAKYFMVLQLLTLLSGCIEDNGNYVYQDESDVLPIAITGLDKNMSALKGSTLSLTPTIENMDNPDRYTYEWFIMEYQAEGTAPQRRDLQKEKDLNWVVNLDPGQWRLNFEVRDPVLDVYRRFEIILSIKASPLASGWYILEDNDEGTEVDYVTKEGEMYPNALGVRVPGEAVTMVYQSARYNHTITDDNGKVTTITGLSAYHVLTTKDIYTFNGKDLTLLKTYKDLFYTTPDKCDPQSVLFASSDLYLMNANKIHYIYGMSPNIGKLSAAVTGLYHLYPLIIPYTRSQVLVFDKDSHSFYNANSMNSTLISIGDKEIENQTYSFTNMPYDIQCVGITTSSGYNGQSYIVMKHTGEDKNTLMRVTAGVSNADIVSMRDIPAESKMTESNLLAPSFNSDFLYFVFGQSVYSYKNATGLSMEEKEQAWLTYPEDEKISVIRTVSVSGKNNLAVITTKDGKWKLYLYSLIGESTPELNLEPVVVYEGEGNAKYLMYRD